MGSGFGPFAAGFVGLGHGVMLAFRGAFEELGHEGGYAVGLDHGVGDDLDGGGLQAIAFGGDGDGAGGEGGADGDAVDAELCVEVEVVGGVELAGVVAAAPDAGAGTGEVDAGVVGGARAGLWRRLLRHR